MFLKLNNGIEMPLVGLGTFLAKDGEETYQAVLEALKVGYRHIDTAAIYRNEESVGRAIKDSGIPREEIFVTTKLWNDSQNYHEAKKAFEESLKKLQLDYVDLYLIHWPTSYQQAREAWLAMEELYFEGRVRAIGVSNFNVHHIENLLQIATIIPAVNQVELHPGLQHHRLQEYCMGKGIYLVSHTPLMKGQVFEMDILKDLAKKYNKSVVNIVVRWGMQRKIFMIPKSVTKERILNNFEVFDFSLSFEDMELIKQLNRGKRVLPDPDNYA
jgi:methylglyoxal/glyoxal reductase